MKAPRKKTRKEKSSVSNLEKPVASKIASKLRIQHYYLAIFIAIISFALYSNTLNHGFVLDDNSAIENNWLVKGGTESIPTLFKTSYRHGFWKGVDELYRPIPLSIFAILWEFFPNNPFPFHLLNVLIYALTGSILFLTLVKFLPRYNILIPLIASILFITHPIHTEVVANIKSLDELLSFILVLLSTILIFNYVRKGNLINIFVSSIIFFIALLSKESAITFVAATPLILYFFAKANLKQISYSFISLAVPSIIFLFIRSEIIVPFSENTSFSLIDNIIYGAPDIMTQWATATKLMLMYLYNMLLPYMLSSDYTTPQIVLNGWDDILALSSLMIHIVLFAYAIIKIRSRHFLSFCILFYFITMSIYSNLFVVIGSPFADRFLYIPLLGFTLGVSFLILKIFKSELKIQAPISEVIKSNVKIVALLFLMTATYSYKTMARNLDWVSNYELFKADATNSPNCARIHYFYANEIRKQKAMEASDPNEKIKYLDLSIAEYNKAIELYPNYANAYGQMGMSYYRKNDRKTAYELYDKAIILKTTNATTYNNMGVLFSELSKHTKALEYYNRAVKFDPYYFDAWKNIGNTYYELKDNKRSIESFFEALKYKPNDDQVNYFLAVGLQLDGQTDLASKYFEIAYRLNPSLKEQ
jgi:hypothetical protein